MASWWTSACDARVCGSIPASWNGTGKLPLENLVDRQIQTVSNLRCITLSLFLFVLGVSRRHCRRD